MYVTLSWFQGCRKNVAGFFLSCSHLIVLPSRTEAMRLAAHPRQPPPQHRAHGGPVEGALEFGRVASW
jgi:hypothetical protein